MSIWDFLRALRFGFAIGGSLAASSLMGGGLLRLLLAVPIGLGVSAAGTLAIAGLDRALERRGPGRALSLLYAASVLALDVASGVLAFFVARGVLGWLG